MKHEVHLGFEVGSGQPVTLPLRHMVVTGQTQEAGKTTTLEALIERAGVKAVAFITKRGEGSFSGARIVPPYFREQTDWQFVASILEASRGEKLKFERAWIIRASKGASSLADVQRNVRKSLDSAKGLSADVYLTLDAYLEAVVPQIERVRWAQSVELGRGVNAMDLSGLNVEMQHLVIRSTIRWVLEKEENTVVVVPEAWKFIPQGRGTPVKLAAEEFIRQAAGLKNYLWLDSQDIAGVEKMILKSVPVWILGVQRESNEVKRTLAQIPAGIRKPKPEEVATLGLGEFFACHGKHVTKVYVQPTWMSDVDAERVARGWDDARAIQPPKPKKEHTVTEHEAKALREENAQLKAEIAELKAQVAKWEKVVVRGGKPELLPGPMEFVPSTGLDEQLYGALKARLLREAPALLKILAMKPELEVEVRRETVNVDATSWLGRVAALIAEGWFDQPRKAADVFKEATRRGATGVPVRADEACKKLWNMGFLTREADGYLAVRGMKVNIVEAA